MRDSAPPLLPSSPRVLSGAATELTPESRVLLACPQLGESREPMETVRSAPPGDGAAEALLKELERQVQDVVRASSWWERHGVDCAILALSLLALPAGTT